MRLDVEQVTWEVETKRILNEVTLNANDDEFVGLIGPNGSGKSSLLRCIYRSLRPNAGLISIDGGDIAQMTIRDSARKTAVVLQETPSEFDFQVEEIVFMGRTPHKGLLDRETDEDRRIVAESLERVGMTEFADRNFWTLSGGEKQRVIVARALAQQTRFLVLDEPTNHLDIKFQIGILDLVKGLRVTTLAALHDLNLAASYCDRIYAISDGEIVASGAPEEVLRPELIRSIYGIGAIVQPHPKTGRPHLLFYSDNGH
ncbi:MAG: ABC transporter ATP-binding protein [Chloroflexi bacterium]|nr:ABC transporter ATP-binding protein [Chloroflexota bacterium]MCY3938442.1 ABC transporter ATP-binding protein [Chloroflexota bacterium]